MVAAVVLAVVSPPAVLPTAADSGHLLDMMIATAMKPVPAAKSAEENAAQEQLGALDFIRDLPTETAEEEAKIVAAMKILRKSPDVQVADRALQLLGTRNHQELLPELAAEISPKDDAFATYPFEHLTDFIPGFPPPNNLPPNFLREGLKNPNPYLREAMIKLVDKFQARELRPAIEEVLFGDPREGNRIAAANLLGKWQLRESLPALRVAFRGSDAARMAVGDALASIGSDAELDLLIPLLHSPSTETRSTIARAIGFMSLENSGPAKQALLPLLKDRSRKVRISAIRALGEKKELRVVPVIRELLQGRKVLYTDERKSLIRALGAVGDEAAVALLNEMDFSDSEVREEVLRLARPSTAYAAWDAYLCAATAVDPNANAWTTSYALTVLEKLADEEIFRAIRLRAHHLDQNSTEVWELASVIEKLGQRFPKAAAQPIDSLTTKAELLPSDRDHDGVPDRFDKYPDDPKRFEDVVVTPEPPDPSPKTYDQFPMVAYDVIPFSTKGPTDSKKVYLSIIGKDDQHAWLTKINDADPPDYYLASGTLWEFEEWPLPNPGDTPGVYRLDPQGINPSGIVVGTASRKKVAIPLRQDVREPHVTYQSGFIFEKGHLRFDPPPPFTGVPPNVSYHLINSHGLIFGHRELRTREGNEEVFRRYAFLGDQVFREVPLFSASVLTDKGQLLCSRVISGKLQTFVWDGEKFMELGSLAGKPEEVRAFAMNQKLQVVGLSDALDKDQCPTGFFWENGKMRAFSELIPEEFRPQLRSAVPYRIDDAGEITFRAEAKESPSPELWPKYSFVLQLREEGNNGYFVQHFGGDDREED